MGKKVQLRDEKVNERVEAVLQLVRKQSPLTVKQENFCNNACVERFLRAKGDNVKKAAKHLRACLSWRESIGAENLTADEFSAELAEGVAYVAGHDEESKPVIIFRIKPDYQKFHSQKLFTRLLVFTLEVAIGTMPKNVEQFVLLFDARYLRSAPGFMSFLVGELKIVGDYYPGRLYKAFVIDPPSLFSYLWMGVRPFLELSTATMVLSSLDFEESLDFNHFASYAKASSFRFDSSSIKSTAMIGSCSSSRFTFTVSHHFDSLKPWHLTFTDTSTFKVGPTSPSPLSPALISPLNSRSLSFASSTEKTSRGNSSMRKTMFPSTPLPQRSQASQFIKANHPPTPRPSFLQSPAEFFRRGGHVSTKTEKPCESFLPFLKFYRRPYDEIIYRSIIKPPLGGLISTVKRRHMPASRRFYTKK